jgi:hypothetical protein
MLAVNSEVLPKSVLLPVANDNKWGPIKWVRIFAIRF